MDDLQTRTNAEWSLLRLAYQYARALDRRDAHSLRQLFTEDALLERPDAPPRNREEICRIPDALSEQYVATMHTVLNQTMDVVGAAAEGETYCIAYHVMRGPGGTALSLNKALRYQDSCVERDGRWLFRRRVLINDWTEVRQVLIGGGSLIA